MGMPAVGQPSATRLSDAAISELAMVDGMLCGLLEQSEPPYSTSLTAPGDWSELCDRGEDVE